MSRQESFGKDLGKDKVLSTCDGHIATKTLFLLATYFSFHYRWIIVNISNETQFSLKYAIEWFDVGRFWDAPSGIAKFSRSAYSGCSTKWGAAGYHGVSGAALFHLQIPGQLEDHPITIAFSNPGTGSIKTRAEFCQDMKDVWGRMVKQCTSYAEKEVELQCSCIKLQLTATPGNQAIVTITQTPLH